MSAKPSQVARILLVAAGLLLAAGCGAYVVDAGGGADAGGILPAKDAGDGPGDSGIDAGSSPSDGGPDAAVADSGFNVCSGARTCAELGIECGPAGDGCNNIIHCGTCAPPTTCGGGGEPGKCGGAQGCVPRTCAGVGANCGPVSDGCGGLLECGTCTPPQTCGGGGTSSVCGGSKGCVPRTCAGAGANCGPLADGCGGLLDCGTCASGQTCGAGGESNRCGVVAGADAGSACVPKTCAELGIGCGPAGDGCGGQLSCGTCTTGSCGGGGTPGVCGAPTCVRTTCAQQGLSCGPAGDGCGGVLDCGSCSGSLSCGGGGVGGVCGSTCVPRTCAQQGIECGPAGDGCGNLLQCGSCTSPKSCGGGGSPGICGAPPACVPKTCDQLFGTGTPKSCGPAGDGCGGLLDCGPCNLPTTCGGAGVASHCGIPPTCTNLCLQQQTCSPGTTTTVSGTVYDPAGINPLYDMLVYIPNSAVAPFPAGVSCGNCSALVTGSPLVSTFTGTDGKFQLSNVPVGSNIPLVIQSGRWRRQVTIPSVVGCQDNALDKSLTHLPKNKGQGDIPLTAISTGAVDSLECVLRKMGIDDAEFTQPSGAGRIRVYTGIGAAGAGAGTGTPTEAVLLDSLANLKAYDMVLLPCQGAEYFKIPGTNTYRVTSARQQNLIDYASAGGRLFSTHYSYVWLYNDAPFSGTANWRVKQTSPSDQDGILNMSFDRGQALARWLINVGATTTLGKIPIYVLRNDVQGVVPPSQSWMTVPNPTSGQPDVTMHYTFNTPVGAAADQQCGRVLFDDFHVEDASNNKTTNKTFPDECSSGAMTAQEKLLEFMLFDLGSCVTPFVPACTPKTCAQLGFNCGPQGDGCGGQLNCGACTSPEVCGGGGVPGVCGSRTCTPRTCAQLGVDCGPAGDGCGAALDCGTCTSPEVCGGGGSGLCGPPPPCTRRTCAQQGFNCGPAGDGCGGQLDCGLCAAPQFCGAVSPGVCGVGPCTPRTCAQQGFNCGPAGDGCGGALDCGTCAGGLFCGGGEARGVCSPGTNCVPTTCAAQGLSCGPAGDGCGGRLDCGSCGESGTCGGGGVPGVCGMPACTPLTCAQMGFSCGPAGDGCGNQIDCGTCDEGMGSCGGGGTPGVCGSPSCTPVTCQDLNYNCGLAADGCGYLMNCGTCLVFQVCGGDGVPNRCSQGPN